MVSALKGQTPIIIDSGVRRGVDILKAAAMGAQAVAIGRAVLYGAAAGGESGARRALQILTDELRLALMLSGTSSMAEARTGLGVLCGK